MRCGVPPVTRLSGEMTMKLVLAMMIACACCLAAEAGQFSFDSQLGVVDTNSEGRLCLKISDPKLADGTEVNFVVPDRPQRLVRAAVEAKAPGDCSRNPGTDPQANFYLLKLVGGKQGINLGEPLPPSIAVVRPAGRVSVRRGTASGDIDGDGRAEFFRICSSTEGNHLTVWTGKPLLGKRRWHSYYYLGFDVVPDCKKKDFQ
jgi:hypothetical protein